MAWGMAEGVSDRSSAIWAATRLEEPARLVKPTLPAQARGTNSTFEEKSKLSMSDRW